MKIKNNVLLKVEKKDIKHGTCFIPDNVKKIGKNAFEELKIKFINIPKTVTCIEEGAFSDCIKLKAINIPNSVTRIGRVAFANCNNLIKKGKYTTCNIIRDGDNITYSCCGTEYVTGKQMPVIDDIECHQRGYHYCENLYDIFNYYYGDLNDIALCEVEPGDIIEYWRDSYRVTNTFKIKKLIPWNEAFNS